MKTYWTIFLFPLFSIALTAQAEWNNTAPISMQGRYEDLHFISPDTGWTVSGGGGIHRTYNGGDSWEQLYFNSDYYFRSIGFADSQLGFAGTLDATLLKTENGGENWVDITPQLPITPSGICGMQWLDDQNFMAVGAWFGPAFLIRTNDRGESWTALNLNEYASRLVDLHFISQDTGFVCGGNGNGGVILHTTDGGENWDTLYSTGNPGDLVWKLQFIDEKHAVASVQTFGTSSWMPYTEDGGLSWDAKFVPYGDAQGIGFITPEKGWIGGYQAGLYATENGGESWNVLPFGINFNRFQVFSPNLAYASGAQIYKYVDTTTIVATEPATDTELLNPMMKVSPNPATTEALVTFKLPRANNVDLNLYDAQGKLLQKILNARLSAGEHNIPVHFQGKRGYHLIGLQLNEGTYAIPLILH
jgi:photosystem II stability/assembly factor-like uncharacterized protein